MYAETKKETAVFLRSLLYCQKGLLNFLDIVHQIADAQFKFHTVARQLFPVYVLIIRLCDLDGVSGEVDRNGQRLRNRRTTHQRTGQNACENIARAVHPFRGVFPVGFVELSRFAVIGGSAVTVTLADTGDDRRAASQFGQLFQIAVICSMSHVSA